MVFNFTKRLYLASFGEWVGFGCSQIFHTKHIKFGFLSIGYSPKIPKEETFISFGWHNTFSQNNWEPTRGWDGKTVYTTGPKGLGVYDINSEFCPDEIREQALNL